MNNIYLSSTQSNNSKLPHSHYLVNPDIKSTQTSDDTNNTATVKIHKSQKNIKISDPCELDDRQQLLRNLLMESVEEQETIKSKKSEILKVKQENSIEKSFQVNHSQNGSILKQEVSEGKTINYRNFERIEDLDQQTRDWELLARVIDMTYREFVSKQGRPIKLLTFEFIDGHGGMIEGCCFGALACLMKKSVQKGKIYRISNAKVEKDTYSKHKPYKYSSFQLRIHLNTNLIEAEEIIDIPECRSNFIRLYAILSNNLVNQEHNFVGIILKIKPIDKIPKNGETLMIQKIKIGDPITDTVLDVTIWNRTVEVEEQMLNKTVVLRHFKVSEYKDQYILMSTFKSSIERNNLFKEYEGIWLPLDVKTYQIEKKQKQIVDEKHIKSIKDLEWDLNKPQKDEIVYSYLNVWLTDLYFDQKWFYTACPNRNCKKVAKPYTICQKCSTKIEQCTKMFSLKVQLSDCTGSITATAFTESVNEFMKDVEISQLMKMSQENLSIKGDGYKYNNYIVKLCSKTDIYRGLLSHSIVGVPERVQVKQQLAHNFRLIDDLTKQIMENQILFKA